MTVFEQLLLTDLVSDLPQAIRLQRLVSTLRSHFRCDAVALLQLDNDHLRPIATDGLAREALGRRFAVSQHPRLAAILARRGITSFDHDSILPDPYDGLVNGHAGEPLPVHDCMGARLHTEGRLWGLITLDALEATTFDANTKAELQRFLVLIEATIRVTRLETEIRALRISRNTNAPPDASQTEESLIIGQSGAITRVLHELDIVADTELPVLLSGETGVGKELFAHRLHRLSRRRDKALVHVNCAALPESLAESELFGHVKGAFSGAAADRPGRFEAADGGTLFLDEVGELPLAIQAKLLRTLQNGEIQRLGADQPRHVNVRVIAATNRNLRDHVRDGSFRADLYHRLSVYPIPIPALRERSEDVPMLAGHFLELNRARLGLRSLRLSAEAEAALQRYHWPGNVRELEHVVSRAALKAVGQGVDRNDIVTLSPALMDLDSPAPLSPESTIKTTAEAAAVPIGRPLRVVVAACQRQAIRQALAAQDNNWARAAHLLDLDPSNLHKLARRLGLKAR